MPKRKRPEETPEEQFKRFLETAREHEMDKKKAESTFGSIASPKEGSNSHDVPAKPAKKH